MEEDEGVGRRMREEEADVKECWGKMVGEERRERERARIMTCFLRYLLLYFHNIFFRKKYIKKYNVVFSSTVISLPFFLL